MIKSTTKVGYVLKRYPRYSETFIVNEILAHEKAGLNIDIFALRPPCDSHFQNIISQVKASVTYIPKPIQPKISPFIQTTTPSPASYLWAELQETALIIPDFWQKLAQAMGERATVVYQSAWLAKQIMQRKITHLHAHFGSIATSVARLAAYFADIPYTFTTHAKDIYHQSVDVADMRKKIRDSKTVITVSDYNRQYLQQVYGEVGNSVQRIYNGLDLTKFHYQTPENRPRNILFVGRLVEKKGLPILLNACALLQEWQVNFHCQIVGTGELKESLSNQIQHLKLEKKIDLLGAYPQNQVLKIMQESAVFVAPYIIGKDGNRDGLPTVLLEAMALGNPCVGTDVTGIPELIRHEKTGLIVPQKDELALALALQKLLEDSTLRVDLATNARKLMESDFDIHINSELLRRLFIDKLA